MKKGRNPRWSRLIRSMLVFRVRNTTPFRLRVPVRILLLILARFLRLRTLVVRTGVTVLLRLVLVLARRFVSRFGVL